MSSTSPIFIGGLMKSGTSLVRKLVSRHEAIFGGLETHWFSGDFIESWRDPSTRRAAWLRGFFDVSEVDYERMLAASSSGIDLFDRFMKFCANRAGKRRWVEKTPDNIHHFTTIREHWPTAQFIHVVRDPRDVYGSWKTNGKLSLAALVEQVRAIDDELGALLGTRSDGYLEVRYEDLVRSPEATMRDLTSWLGEKWHSDLAEYTGDTEDHDKVLAITGKRSATTESLKRPIFDSSVGRWRQELDPIEVSLLERELADYLRRWGYA